MLGQGIYHSDLSTSISFASLKYSLHPDPNRQASSLNKIFTLRMRFLYPTCILVYHLNLSPQFCIPPVLKAIQMFGSSPRLKALSIQLLTDLWKIQDRSFPYLLKAITEPAPGVLTMEGVDEVKLAKVKAIRDVCMLR